MKILFPQNIFASLLVETLPDELVSQISYTESSRLYSELEADRYDVALIPALELIKNKDLYVSKKICVGFNGFLCNSFVYFIPDQLELSKLFVTGDVSAHDVMISKFLFTEMYNKNIEISLLADKNASTDDKNLQIIGDDNFENLKLLHGLSISEEMTEMISFPYINYVLASKSGVNIDEFNQKVDKLNVSFDENIEKIVNAQKLPQDAKEYVIDQAGSFTFELGEAEEHGLNELLRLPYFYGMIDDIIEIKAI